MNKNKIAQLLVLVMMFSLCSLVVVGAPQKKKKNILGSHSIDVWGGGGYSLLMHDIENSKPLGGGGGLFGFGYEWEYKKFLLNLGAEFMYLNSTTRINDFKIDASLTYNDPYNTDYVMNYYMNFDHAKEAHNAGYANIPLLIGLKFDRYYFLAGAKLGLGVFGNYSSNANLTTMAEDPQLIDPFTNMPNHTLTTSQVKSNGSLGFNMDLKASAEFGLYLNEWFPKKALQLPNKNKTPISYRLALFCDYGFLNINKNSTTNPLIYFPDIIDNGNGTHTLVGNGINNVQMNSLLTTTAATNNPLNSLLVGVKFTVLFNVKPEPKKKPKTLPLPLLIVKTYDKDTEKPLDGVLISAINTQTKRSFFSNKSTRKGTYAQRVKVGDYALSVTKNEYNNATKPVSLPQLGDTVQVDIYLEHRPVLWGEIRNDETDKKLSATITIINKETAKVAYSVVTDSLAATFRTLLPDGNYSILVNKMGFQSYSNDLKSINDSLYIRLTPIKKGVKVMLNNLFFATDKTDILPESETELENLYRFLSDNPEVRIKIIGHTDNVGSVSHNQRLSEGRAKSVLQSMTQRGIDPSRIQFEGRGSSEPITTNDTDEGRTQNRRVEFIIL